MNRVYCVLFSIFESKNKVSFKIIFKDTKTITTPAYTTLNARIDHGFYGQYDNDMTYVVHVDNDDCQGGPEYVEGEVKT